MSRFPLTTFAGFVHDGVVDDCNQLVVTSWVAIADEDPVNVRGVIVGTIETFGIVNEPAPAAIKVGGVIVGTIDAFGMVNRPDLAPNNVAGVIIGVIETLGIVNDPEEGA